MPTPKEINDINVPNWAKTITEDNGIVFLMIGQRPDNSMSIMYNAEITPLQLAKILDGISTNIKQQQKNVS